MCFFELRKLINVMIVDRNKKNPLSLRHTSPQTRRFSNPKTLEINEKCRYESILAMPGTSFSHTIKSKSLDFLKTNY
jgi:hypothetical protein